MRRVRYADTPRADKRCGVDDKRRLILDQALALVDERGLAAMSMRAVAERVGLTSMALYPYVGGKDALLDGLVDLLHLELGAACADPGHLDWRQRLRALGRAVRALAHTHPGAFPLLLNRSAAGPSASWLAAALRGVLHDAGAGAADEPRLARMICAFFLGYATGEITGGLPGSLPPDLSARADPMPPDVSASADSMPPDVPAHADPMPLDVSARAEPVLTGRSEPLATVTPGTSRRFEPLVPAAGEMTGREGAGGMAGRDEAGAAEFDADLEDLVRLVEVAVRGR